MEKGLSLVVFKFKKSALKRFFGIFTLVLLFTLVLFAISVFSQPTILTYKGAVIEGGKGYFEVEDIIHINISDYVNKPGAWSLINFSTKYAGQKTVTVFFKDLANVALERHDGYTLVNETIFNLTTNTTILGNGSMDGHIIEVNHTNITHNVSVWNNINLKNFTYQNKTVQGRTVNNFGSQLNDMYRINGHCPDGARTCEYSIVFNTTIAGQQVFVDFDPDLEAGALELFHYPMNECATTTTLLDNSSNHFNGTLVGMTANCDGADQSGWNSTCQLGGNCLGFDGNDGVDTDLWSGVNSTVFWAGWFLSINTGDNGIMMASDDGGAGILRVTSDLDGHDSYEFNDGSGFVDWVIPPNRSNFSHVVMGFFGNSSARRAVLWIDGELSANVSMTNAIILSGQSSLGARPTSMTAENHAGWMNDIRGYDFALSEDDIDLIYNDGVPIYTSLLDLRPAAEVDSPPLFFSNYTNNSLPKFGEHISLVINWSDDNNLNSIFADHNLTQYGIYENFTANLTTKAWNITFNISSTLKYSNATSLNTSRIIVRANDSADQFNETLEIIFTAANTLPTINNNNTNFTEHFVFFD